MNLHLDYHDFIISSVYTYITENLSLYDDTRCLLRCHILILDKQTCIQATTDWIHYWRKPDIQFRVQQLLYKQQKNPTQHFRDHDVVGFWINNAQLKCPLCIMCLGVTMMEWQYSLTPQAMAFHICAGKPQSLQFLIVGQPDIMLYRVEIGLLMNLLCKIF